MQTVFPVSETPMWINGTKWPFSLSCRFFCDCWWKVARSLKINQDSLEPLSVFFDKANNRMFKWSFHRRWAKFPAFSFVPPQLTLAINVLVFISNVAPVIWLKNPFVKKCKNKQQQQKMDLCDFSMFWKKTSECKSASGDGLFFYCRRQRIKTDCGWFALRFEP